jgi:hypothetical protein
MIYFVKLAPSPIGIVHRKPYLRGFSTRRGFLQAFWGDRETALEQFPLRTRRQAFEAARRWGPSWKENVRVVRFNEQRAPRS